MEKKYLIGYLHGQPHVMFDDIQNFKEEADENGDIHVTFTDKDDDYHYVQGAGGFREINNKAPKIEDYEVRGRRTIKRKGLDTKMTTRVNPNEYQEYQEKQNKVEGEDAGAVISEDETQRILLTTSARTKQCTGDCFWFEYSGFRDGYSSSDTCDYKFLITKKPYSDCLSDDAPTINQCPFFLNKKEMQQLALDKVRAELNKLK